MKDKQVKRKISEKNQAKIIELRQELDSLAGTSTSAAEYSDLELDSFLQFNKKSIAAAAKAVLAAQRYKQEHPVTIADVASYYRAPAGQKLPPAFLVCLEDGQGDCARDHEGRPIIWMLGIIYGTSEELKQQLQYALQRAAHYRLPHHRPDEVCFVTEVMSRTPNYLRLGLNSTFRFPDAAVRSLFDYMKTTFPGSQYSTLHFCGLPSFVTSSFKLIKPFVSPEVFNRLQLKSNFKHLKRDGFVEPHHILPEWDSEGTFEFDLDQYVEWRAQEEGITDVCPRGMGRSYDSTYKDPRDFGLTTEALLGTPERRDHVVKEGWIEKRGSGIGLFSSYRWKAKYVVLTEGCLFYFETDAISETNVASRMIMLDTEGADSTVEWLKTTAEAKNDKSAMICLTSERRDYIFGFASQQEGQEWLDAIHSQCGGTQEVEESSISENSSEDLTAPAIKVNPSAVSTLFVGDY